MGERPILIIAPRIARGQDAGQAIHILNLGSLA
jgi:hypothetical protein